MYVVISIGSQHSTTGVDLSTRQPLACTDTIQTLPIALVAHEKGMKTYTQKMEREDKSNYIKQNVNVSDHRQ